MNRKHLRGSSTGGKGSGKRARHAGNRGGVGRAGGGKRGQQKMTSIRAHEHTYTYSRVRKIPLNLNNIKTIVDSMDKKGLLKKDEDRIVINLADLGYSKVCGRFSKGGAKLAVYGKVSERARTEIKAAGGEVYE